MATTSVFNLTRFTALAAGDVVPVVDISDTTQSAHGSLDAITVTNFFTNIPVAVSVLNTVTATGFVGPLTGNADTATLAAHATALATARAINGVSFDGTADITITAAAGTLSGSTLASGVTASSLTSVGVLAAPHMTSPVINSGGLNVAGGSITVAAGGTISTSTGGNITAGAGGNITAGSSGNVTSGAGGNVVVGLAGSLIVSFPPVPASASAAGTKGTVAWESGFVYICIATNTWQRVAIATW